MSHLDVNIPDTYKGCAVTALSGYVSPTGPGRLFKIMLYKGFDKGTLDGGLATFDIAVNTQSEFETAIKHELGENIIIKDNLVFNLHIEANLQELGEPLEQLLEFDESDYFRLYIVSPDNTQTYAISFFVTVDERNKSFYSDKLGRMYYKDTDNLVRFFSITTERASPNTAYRMQQNRLRPTLLKI